MGFLDRPEMSRKQRRALRQLDAAIQRWTHVGNKQFDVWVPKWIVTGVCTRADGSCYTQKVGSDDLTFEESEELLNAGLKMLEMDRESRPR